MFNLNGPIVNTSSDPKEENVKKKLGGINVLYPTPTTIVGAIVEEKPNFITIAHIGIINHVKPHLISLSMGKVHFTNAGIKQNKVFSVNIASENLVVETDYVGLVSGKKADKSKIFEIFYGVTKKAPMIKECLLNMECKLYDVYDIPTHDIFIGEIIETYADESVFSNDKIDIAKVKPLLFDMSSIKYWSLGKPIASCWNVGKKMKMKQSEDNNIK
jgi:flavin reductase (DIM6/NTAB) family NADH-FMN oxidoreductase RutF